MTDPFPPVDPPGQTPPTEPIAPQPAPPPPPPPAAPQPPPPQPPPAQPQYPPPPPAGQPGYPPPGYGQAPPPGYPPGYGYPPPAQARPPRALADAAADPVAWAAMGIVIAVVVKIFADLVLAADRLSAIAYSRSSDFVSGISFRSRLIVFTAFTSFDVVLALLLAAVLLRAVTASKPAAFRRATQVTVGVLALAVGALAVIRSFLLVSYGHAYGVGNFFEQIAVVPVAAVAAMIVFAAAEAVA